MVFCTLTVGLADGGKVYTSMTKQMKNTEETIHGYAPARVVDARKSKGFSQEELAFAAGLSLRTVQRIEKGSVRPRLYSLKALANALDCTLDHFRETAEENFSRKDQAVNRMSLAVYSVVFLPFLPLLLQAIFWCRAAEVTEEEDHRCRRLLHFQGRWLAALVLTLLALPLVTRLLTGQVSYGDFPLAFLIYLLFVGVNLGSILLPEGRQRYERAMT